MYTFTFIKWRHLPHASSQSKASWRLWYHISLCLLLTCRCHSMPSCTDDVYCFGVKLYLFVFITFRSLPLCLPRSHGLRTSYRWSMNKGPLTDLQGMSIKLECHVLSVTHSHAVLTPRWWDMTCKFVHSRMDISNICFPIKLHYSLIKGHIFSVA